MLVPIPSNRSVLAFMRRLGGSPLIAVTFVTPGTACKRSCNWLKKADWRAPSGYVSAGKNRRNVSNPLGRNPSSTCCSDAKLRNIKPAPMTSTTANANSATTSERRRTKRADPAVARCPPSRNAIPTLPGERWNTGASPKRTPATMETRKVNSNTDASSPTSLSRGMLSGLVASRSLTPTAPAIKPTTPPTIDRTMLSVRNCRMSRARPAPSAVRTAISFRRDSALASNRLPTFAQAMSKTNPTAPSSTNSAGRTSPTTSSCSGFMLRKWDSGFRT